MEERKNNEKSVILITDDSKTNILSLSKALETEYKIIIARSGREGLELAIKERPDLILLDIVMPDMDGYEVLKELKNSDETSFIPVIFLSGLGRPEDESMGLFLGAVDYISKPFVEPVVKARVKTHVQIARQMRLVERLGLVDPLTELTNKRGFDRQIKAEWSRALRYGHNISVIMIDVDRFKAFNEAYGHPSGDLALARIARAIEENLSRPTDFAARVGGEEFSIILPNTDLEGAKMLGEKIRAAVMGLKIPSGISLSSPITISLSVETEIPKSLDTLPEFVARCEDKMRASKKAGGNTLTYEL